MAEMSRLSRWMVNRRGAGRAARLLRTVGPALPPVEAPSILEVGAGKAALSALLYDRYRPSRLVATDYDPAQVDAARSFLLRRFGTIPPVIDVRQADAMALPFEAGAFDWVFAIAMLHHVEARHNEYVRRPAALRELRRILRPGGTLVYSEFSCREQVRATLLELGFSPILVHHGWRNDVAVYRAPG